MPRNARIITDDGIYHILNRGNGLQQVFHKDADYKAFITLLREALVRHRIALYAYCLMPNHFHLLVKAVAGEDLSRCMQWLMTTHVRRYHTHYQSSGHLWQGRYKSIPVEDDEYFLTVACYIEENPVRAGLVETSANWYWSSHRERCGLACESMLGDLPLVLPGGQSP